MNFEAIVQKLPGVASPGKRQTFSEKLKWTAIVLGVYYFLSETFLLNINPANLESYKQIATLLGANFGTIITLGIGPIVSASIILQLLVGAKVISWDLGSHHGRVMFQGTQKILAYLFALLEAAAYVIFGAIPPEVYTAGAMLFVILQIMLGGWLVILLDEVVSKWGFGSGVSLFIAAGIGKEIFIRGFSLVQSNTGEFVGVVPALISNVLNGNIGIDTLTTYVVPILSTIIVFAIVVYAQAMRVEIPLAFGAFRGFGRKWPLKFIYTNVLPVILTAALLINLQVWGRLISSPSPADPSVQCGLLGCYTNGQPSSGFVNLLSPPRQFILNLIQGTLVGDEILRVIVYTLFMVVGSAVFSVFWMNTSGMDPPSVARQIQGIGMQIPGFRRDPRIIERVLERYIPGLAILGGAFVGFLSAFADFTGALVSGTGLLLTVMITYQLYEEIATKHMEDMHPLLRQFMSKNE